MQNTTPNKWPVQNHILPTGKPVNVFCTPRRMVQDDSVATIETELCKKGVHIDDWHSWFYAFNGWGVHKDIYQIFRESDTYSPVGIRRAIEAAHNCIYGFDIPQDRPLLLFQVYIHVFFVNGRVFS